MKFELSKELIDLIIYGMENQDKHFVFDTDRLDLIPAENSDDSDRFVALPVWQSVQGFALMERFVVTLKNPLVRENLRSILVSGRGVFRQFKNALKEHREVERQWFYFKEHAMQMEVMAWYNDLRELWGMQGVQLEDYNFEELLLADFDVRPVDVEKCHSILAEQEGPVGLIEQDGLYWGAAAPDGNIAGICGGFIEEKAFCVNLFYTLPDFRGIGIARFVLDQLVDKVKEQASAHNIKRIEFMLEGESLRLSKHLTQKGSVQVAETLAFSLLGRSAN